MIRVPSARQLVYADKRANPKGRLPDDTWILRPQDVPEAFSERSRHLVRSPRLRHVQGARGLARLPDARAGAGPDHPRLLATRARRCSTRSPAAARPWPWPRSSTGGISACELSEDYADRVEARLAMIEPGQPLEGGDEPKIAVKPGRVLRKDRDTTPLGF